MPVGSRLSLLFELFATEQRVRTLVLAAMADSELRPDEYAVYSVLFDDGPQTPTDLARRAGMPPTTMSHYVRALLDRGHAICQAVPGDRRSYKIGLTASGLRAHANAGRAFAEADRRFSEAISIDEETARTVLDAIGDAATSAEARLRAESIDATA
jgi:DNA-binding MarR family transcriptional regulator